MSSQVAKALTKDRVQIQNDLQKISAGKEQLEALKNMKKVSEPILTPEERAADYRGALKESHQFIDQFYDNFCERKNEIKERSRVFVSASDIEIEQLMEGLSDDLLLANEISYVNSIWDKVSQHRSARNADSDQLCENFAQLKNF